ncbi:hypothetical protein MWU58_08860 [Flavobacteriaceae bacterium S0825]|uniref:hypothetical protein n=1 Tax=Gaetbulibacter sp. S0825 TaxID=2720084 RepID=UPI0014301F54|nr:hypothetical protein [Gaetbulibacter sp. S0825]MCK0109402.1 hypothetical protein [Flavobacteriaceae bacterium S0825]NIX65036.1 hypothetical protein [Gaetbulibacter sp. S0825]
MQELPSNVRIKIQDGISKIHSGEINEDDFELILIRLREYIPDNNIIKEISHFVAHHNRDSGATFNSFYKKYCRMQAYLKYQFNNEKLNLERSLEKWEFDFIIFQLNNLGNKEENNKEVEKVKRYIRKENGKYFVQQRDIPKIISILKYAFSFIKIEPLFSSELIISDFKETLKVNNLQFDNEKVDKFQNGIILAILVLIHKKYFYSMERKIGQAFVNISNFDKEKSSTIELQGDVNLGEIQMRTTLIETNILAEEGILQNLYILDSNSKSFDTNANLTLIDNKLSRLN